MRKSSIAFLVLASAGCASDPSMPMGDDVPGDDEPCTGDACDEDPIVADPLVWTYIEVPGTECIDGTPSGFAVNPNPDSTKLYIYLEGGGACFNDFCDSLFTWSGNIPNDSGIFDRDNPANPVADWNLIYVPYCTGDVYGGDAETMAGGEVRHFRGYSNFTAFLAKWVPSFDLDQVVLSGSSAGGFGALLNFTQTQDAFGTVPVTVIDDSGPPLSSEIFPPCLQQQFREMWGFDRTLLADCGADCDDPDDYILDYLDHVRATYPDLRAGLFSSLEDNTIRLFAGYGWGGGWNQCGSFPSTVTGPVYTQGLEALRSHLMQDGPGMGTYFVPGNGHTVLRTSSLYNQASGGMSPAQWIDDTIRGEPAHVGP